MLLQDTQYNTRSASSPRLALTAVYCPRIGNTMADFWRFLRSLCCFGSRKKEEDPPVALGPLTYPSGLTYEQRIALQNRLMGLEDDDDRE